MSDASTGTTSRASRDAVGEAARLCRESAALLALSSISAAVNVWLAALVLTTLRTAPAFYYPGCGGGP